MAKIIIPEVTENLDLEILDIVDKNNIIIGQETRENIHKNNLLHRSSHIFISYENLVFLQLRSANKRQFPNKWDSSAAGHLMLGEDYYTGAIRELKEELGIGPESTGSSEPILKTIDNKFDIRASEYTGFEFIKIYKLNFNTIPNITLGSAEITTGGWFDYNHINDWLKKHPENFAGCFDLIWQEYLKVNYCNTANY